MKFLLPLTIMWGTDKPCAGHGSMGRAIYTEIQLKSVGMYLKSEQKMHLSDLWYEDDVKCMYYAQLC